MCAIKVELKSTLFMILLNSHIMLMTSIIITPIKHLYLKIALLSFLLFT